MNQGNKDILLEPGIGGELARELLVASSGPVESWLLQELAKAAAQWLNATRSNVNEVAREDTDPTCHPRSDNIRPTISNQITSVCTTSTVSSSGF